MFDEGFTVARWLEKYAGLPGMAIPVALPAGKYFYPYFENDYDQIDTTGVSSAYDESLEDQKSLMDDAFEDE